jgi:altronate hydrolase
MLSAMRLHDADNVAVVLRDLGAGETPVLSDPLVAIQLIEAVPQGHKFALSTIAPGEQIIKYGCVIGTALVRIDAGQHVHLHNIEGLTAASATRERSNHERTIR